MHIVIAGYGPNQYIAERKLSDAGWDETVKDIARGEWNDVSSVIQCSTGVDVLPTMVKQVQDIWADNDEPLTEWQKMFLDEHLPNVRQVVLRKVRAAEVRAAEARIRGLME